MTKRSSSLPTVQKVSITASGNTPELLPVVVPSAKAPGQLVKVLTTTFETVPSILFTLLITEP